MVHMTQTIKRVPMLAFAALLLVGGGCSSLADDAMKPVSVPVDALHEAQQISIEAQAAQTAAAETNSNEVGVVMILIDGSEVPAGATPGKEVIGCNDLPAVTKLTRETASGDVLRDALNTLFAAHDTNVNGLHNSLDDATLKVDKIQSTDGVTTEVWISGELNSSGVCDDPRITEQVEGTIRRFRPKYKVFWNGSESAWRCHGDMSGECK
jgi:hypothetical protein